MIDVVAAVIKKNNHYFIAQRNRNKHFAYYWEFPGGKVDNQETFLNALKREIKEELLINTPVVVTNRCSTETRGKHKIRFWGSSFTTNSDGEIIKQAARTNKTIVTSIDLRDKPKSLRKWGFKIQ